MYEGFSNFDLVQTFCNTSTIRRQTVHVVRIIIMREAQHTVVSHRRKHHSAVVVVVSLVLVSLAAWLCDAWVLICSLNMHAQQ